MRSWPLRFTILWTSSSARSGPKKQKKKNNPRILLRWASTDSAPKAIRFQLVRTASCPSPPTTHIRTGPLLGPDSCALPSNAFSSFPRLRQILVSILQKNKHKADFTNQNTTTWPSPSFRFHFLFLSAAIPPKIGIPSIPSIAIAVKTKQTSQLAKKRDHVSFQKPKKKAACVDCVVKSKAGSTVSTATAATAPKEYRVPSCFFPKASMCVWDRSAK